MHLPATKIEIDAIVATIPEAFRDTAQFQDGRSGGHRARFYDVKDEGGAGAPLEPVLDEPRASPGA